MTANGSRRVHLSRREALTFSISKSVATISSKPRFQTVWNTEATRGSSSTAGKQKDERRISRNKETKSTNIQHIHKRWTPGPKEDEPTKLDSREDD
jgi:hypothetical protein